jgi:uncharacterized protein
MFEILRKRSWSPYAVGALIGVLSWFAFATANKPIGITTAFEYTAAILNQQFAPESAAANTYYAAPDTSPKIDWEWMLVIGVFLGSFWSARLSGTRTFEKVPDLWSARFGQGAAKRFAAAFLGGALMMFGARVAQGCTSGHGISGALQLAVSSWIFVAVLFATAAATAFALYGRRGAGHV